MRYAIIFILIHFATVLLAQQETLDSLERTLLQVPESTKVDLLVKLAELYYSPDIKKSLAYSERALALAQQLKDEHGMYRAYKILRRIHRRFGNFSVAAAFTLNTLPQLEQQKDTLEVLDSYLILGNIYSSMENYTAAHHYLLKAAVLAKAKGHPELANAYTFLGRNYGKQAKYDSAIFYIKAALALEGTQPKADYGLGNAYNYLGEVFTDLGKYNEALYYYSLASMLNEPQISLFGKTFTQIGLARVYQKQKDYAKAIKAATDGIKIAKANLYRDRARILYYTLYEIYEAQKNYPLALENYKIANLYKDTIFNEDKLQYIENLQVNYQTQKLAQENELLRKETELKNAHIRQQRMLNWVAAATVLFLLIGSFMLYRINVQRRQHTALLQEYSQSLEQQVASRTIELAQSNVELKKRNSQLEQFSYIIAHNLRAPLARITGLVNIISTQKLPDPEIGARLAAAASELETTVEDLTDILRLKKGVNESYSTVNLSERIEKACLVLREKMKEVNPELQLDIKKQTCYAIPAYIDSVLYNLLSNSLKYKANDRPLVIRIESRDEDGKCHFKITDNGMGFDYEKMKEKTFNLYQRFHTHVDGKGLGLFLIKTQVEAMNGTIEVASQVNKGTTFTITLPDNQPTAQPGLLG